MSSIGLSHRRDGLTSPPPPREDPGRYFVMESDQRGTIAV